MVTHEYEDPRLSTTAGTRMLMNEEIPVLDEYKDKFEQVDVTMIDKRAEMGSQLKKMIPMTLRQLLDEYDTLKQFLLLCISVMVCSIPFSNLWFTGSLADHSEMLKTSSYLVFYQACSPNRSSEKDENSVHGRVKLTILREPHLQITYNADKRGKDKRLRARLQDVFHPDMLFDGLCQHHEMQNMRNCYDSLLSAAAATTNIAYGSGYAVVTHRDPLLIATSTRFNIDGRS
ncbi:hypothetical protein ACFE04_022309 [Oxalis oulophora]